MHRNKRTALVESALVSFLLLSAVCVAAEPLIEVSAAQVKSAGIVVEAVMSPAAESELRSAPGLRLSGQVITPGDSTEVALSAVAGQVEAVLVQVGESVRANQPLVRVFSAELAAMQREYLHARAEEGVAKSRLERDESLFAEGIIAESRVREARAGQVMALATLREHHRMLQLAGYSDGDIEALTPESLSSRVTIRARTAAAVLDQGVAVGQRVEPGTELFRLAQGGRLWLELRASATQASGVRVGDSVSVEGCPKPGRVIAVGSQLNASSQTASVRAEMPDAAGCLRANQFVDAGVRQASVPAGSVGVPSGAVVRNGDRNFVFVQEGSGFRPVAVRVVQTDGNRAWVQGALALDAKVASRGLVALKGAWLGLGPQPEQGGGT